MKLRVHRVFRYAVNVSEEAKVRPGEYEVPGDLDKETATLVVKHKCGRWVHEKKAPENKVVAPVEVKEPVATKKAFKKKARSRTLNKD